MSVHAYDIDNDPDFYDRATEPDLPQQRPTLVEVTAAPTTDLVDAFVRLGAGVRASTAIERTKEFYRRGGSDWTRAFA